MIIKRTKKEKRATDRIANNPKSRTVSVISLKNDRLLFISPNLKALHRSVYVYEEGPLSFNITPEINRTIVEQVKMFTRQRKTFPDFSGDY